MDTAHDPSAAEVDGHELGFWKQPPGFDLDPKIVFATLRDGNHVDGLATLPLREMIEAIAAAFTGWNRIDTLDWEADSGEAFQLFTTPQFLSADCYSMSGEDRNRIIDVALKFECPPYDTTIDQRF